MAQERSLPPSERSVTEAPQRPVLAETAEPPGSLWSRMKADPQYAPEHLALEAVRRLGPEAAEWTRLTRADHPELTPDQLADLAIKRFTTLARISGAAAGATGLPGAVLDVGVLAWNQARMVLHVAAAYDHDPTAPERATDLLVLQRVHKAAQTARLALGVAAGRERASRLLGEATARPLSGAMVRLGVKLAGMAGVQSAKKIFAKMIPGAAVVLGTWANSAATKNLAVRTRELYRRD
ncbi:EcsC family protein [Paractinoplanes atraurantiacus]|uniref:EcsC family protein n=1 Tax=Paractinoplanes atraurantiacus TaxID=1036182 RepID=UPI000BE2940F|nr:EcsC family protein [Actinoplanes atraurantiacus]